MKVIARTAFGICIFLSLFGICLSIITPIGFLLEYLLRVSLGRAVLMLGLIGFMLVASYKVGSEVADIMMRKP